MQISRSRILGILGLGLNWGIIWGVTFTLLTVVIGGGEEPPLVDTTAALAGIVAGLSFGLILAYAENKKPIAELSAVRVAAWGGFASLVWPVAAGMPADTMIVMCLFGAVYAALMVIVSHAYGRRKGKPSFVWMIIGRSMRDPLRAVCGSSRNGSRNGATTATHY